MPAVLSPPPTAMVAVAPTPPETPRDERIAFKIHDVIECMNRFGRRAHAARDRYLDWVDADRGPTCHERYISYGTHTLVGHVSECTAAATATLQHGPSLPAFETAAQHYAETLVALRPLLVDAARYYEVGLYRADACAHGRELHPQLMAAFGAFETADDELSAIIDALEEERADALLARVAADPALAASSIVERTMIHGRRVVAAVAAVRGTGPRHATEAAALLEAIDAYRLVATEVATHNAGGSQFRRYADELLEVCLVIFEQAQRRRPFPSARQRNAITSAYNHMVDAVNRHW